MSLFIISVLLIGGYVLWDSIKAVQAELEKQSMDLDYIKDQLDE